MLWSKEILKNIYQSGNNWKATYKAFELQWTIVWAMIHQWRRHDSSKPSYEWFGYQNFPLRMHPQLMQQVTKSRKAYEAL